MSYPQRNYCNLAEKGVRYPELEFFPLKTHQRPYKRTASNDIRDSESGWQKKLNLEPKFPDDDGFKNSELDKTTMQREIENLNNEYKKRIQGVEDWKENKEKMIKDKYKVVNRRTGTQYSTYYPNQFCIENGRSACAAISVIAIYDFLGQTNSQLSKIAWEKVVKVGARLWKTWKDEKPTKLIFPHVVQVYNVEIVTHLRQTIKISLEINGDLDDQKAKKFNQGIDQGEYKVSYNLKQAISFLNREEDKASATTFTTSENTISIFYDTKNFYIFDSHGGIVEKKSSLINFEDAEALITYIRTKYPVRQGIAEYNSEFSMAIFEKNLS